MRIIQINMYDSGSTGNIMKNIANLVRQKSGCALTCSARVFTKPRKTFPSAPQGHIYFGNYYENALHYILAQFTGLNGAFSHFGTAKLIRQCKKFKPDIIHLHNLHAFCINLPMLFRYIKKHKIPVVWTFHDCWAFTGHCPHFVMVNCDKWETECHDCPQLSVYPKSHVDNTRVSHRLKKKWFLGVDNLTVVTPSEWLAGLVRKSFLGEYTVKVINNGINLDVFKPTESDFRGKNGLLGKKILLGVSSGWDKRKGLDVFVELSKRLDDEYRIVLVGSNPLKNELSSNVISIDRTENQKELAEIYTAADLFVNPTREENYPTVNMESIACGTPVLTFKTGGSPEISDDSCGMVVDVDDIDSMEREIKRICEQSPYNKENCLERAKNFDMNGRFEEYIELYKEVLYQ